MNFGLWNNSSVDLFVSGNISLSAPLNLLLVWGFWGVFYMQMSLILTCKQGSIYPKIHSPTDTFASYPKRGVVPLVSVRWLNWYLLLIRQVWNMVLQLQFSSQTKKVKTNWMSSSNSIVVPLPVYAAAGSVRPDEPVQTEPVLCQESCATYTVHVILILLLSDHLFAAAGFHRFHTRDKPNERNVGFKRF